MTGPLTVCFLSGLCKIWDYSMYIYNNILCLFVEIKKKALVKTYVIQVLCGTATHIATEVAKTELAGRIFR